MVISTQLARRIFLDAFQPVRALCQIAAQDQPAVEKSDDVAVVPACALGQRQRGQIVRNQFRRERVNFLIESFPRTDPATFANCFRRKSDLPSVSACFFICSTAAATVMRGKLDGVAFQPVAGDFQRSCPPAQHSAGFRKFADQLRLSHYLSSSHLPCR